METFLRLCAAEIFRLTPKALHSIAADWRAVKYSQEIIPDDSPKKYFPTCWKYFPTFSRYSQLFLRYFQLVWAQTKKGKIKWPTSLTCSINLSETPRLGRLYLTSGWIVISLIFQGKVKLHKKLLTLINAQKKRFFWEVFPNIKPPKRLHY